MFRFITLIRFSKNYASSHSKRKLYATLCSWNANQLFTKFSPKVRALLNVLDTLAMHAVWTKNQLQPDLNIIQLLETLTNENNNNKVGLGISRSQSISRGAGSERAPLFVQLLTTVTNANGDVGNLDRLGDFFRHALNDVIYSWHNEINIHYKANSQNESRDHAGWATACGMQGNCGLARTCCFSLEELVYKIILGSLLGMAWIIAWCLSGWWVGLSGRYFLLGN